MASITVTRKKTDLGTMEESSFGALVDKIGALIEEAESLERSLSACARRKLETIEGLKGKIKAHTTELSEAVTAAGVESGVSDDQVMVVEGSIYKADAGKRGTSRKISNMALIKKYLDEMDPDLFLKLVNMNLKDVDAYLTPDEKSAVLTCERKNRTIKISRRVV